MPKTLREILTFFKVSVDASLLDLNQAVDEVYHDLRSVDKNRAFIFVSKDENKFRLQIDETEALQLGALAVFTNRPEACKTNEQIIYVSDLFQRTVELALWFYDNPTCETTVIGVTGTNGKTSTCSYIAQLWSKFEQKVAVLGTIGNGIYPDLKPFERVNTTPHELDLQRLLRQLVNQGANLVVMEVSSHGLVGGRVSGIKFDIGIFTNLSQDHLDKHGTMEEYFKAKRALFFTFNVPISIVNIDCQYGQRLAEELKDHQRTLYTYSLEDTTANYFAQIHGADEKGITAAVFYNQKNITPGTTLKVGIWGLHFFSNMLAAFAAVMQSNLRIAKKQRTVLDAVQHLQNPEGRMELIRCLSLPLIIIDYAHTPEALELALKSIKMHSPDRRLVCMFGCDGDSDKKKRPLMGWLATKLADSVIITTTLNKSEAFKDILYDILKGVNQSIPLTSFETREEAIQWALRHCSEEDVLLLAGKGHERYISYNGENYAFDERKIVFDYWKTKSLVANQLNKIA